LQVACKGGCSELVEPGFDNCIGHETPPAKRNSADLSMTSGRHSRLLHVGFFLQSAPGRPLAIREGRNIVKNHKKARQ
ncbi:MAG: hypothetical protein WBM63_18900, partial [Sedimenticolaceae bacterium]